MGTTAPSAHPKRVPGGLEPDMLSPCPCWWPQGLHQEQTHIPAGPGCPASPSCCQFICPLLSVVTAVEIPRLHEGSSQSLDPAAPQGGGVGSCRELHTTSDTPKSEKHSLHSGTSHIIPVHPALLVPWGEEIAPVQPWESNLGSKMGVADGWDKASCHCHPLPVAFSGFGGPGCPDVSRWGAGMST